MRRLSCSYNNVAKSIRLLDKKKEFLFIQENFMQVRAFERYTPLMLLPVFLEWEIILMNCAEKLLEPTIFFNLYTKSP